MNASYDEFPNDGSMSGWRSVGSGVSTGTDAQ